MPGAHCATGNAPPPRTAGECQEACHGLDSRIPRSFRDPKLQNDTRPGRTPRAAVVDELDQRIMALHVEPGTDDADELAELQAAMVYFGGEVRPDEEAAGDAACLTFVLVPDHAVELVDQVDAFAVEVIR